LTPQSKEGKTVLRFSLDEKWSGKESYVSIAVQDTNSYRYILPMRVLSDDA